MNDLFKKLNVLVKAGINDILGDDRAVGASRRVKLNPAKLGKDIDKEIASLRDKINEALEYEGELQARCVSIQEEVARLDAQADEAVGRGDDSGARYAIDSMQRAQQRLAMAESDLHEHRAVTQELIQRVNTLEAVVADARRAQEVQEQEQAQPALETNETENESAVSMPGKILSDVLRDAREKIASMGDLIAARGEVNEPPGTPVEEKPASSEVVEDDLAERRNRLSKR